MVWLALVGFWAERTGPRNVGMGTGMGIILMQRYKVEKDVEKRKRKEPAQILQKEYRMVKRAEEREVGG